MGRAKLHAIRERYVAPKAKFSYTMTGHKPSSSFIWLHFHTEGLGKL